MRNGIVLAQLAHWFAPGTVRRIFTVRASVSRNVAQNADLLNWQNFVYCRRSDFNSVIPIISTTFSKQSNSYDYQTFSGSNWRIFTSERIYLRSFTVFTHLGKSHVGIIIILHCATWCIRKLNLCAHSHLLARRNLAPNIKNLVGQLEFTSKQ